MPYKFVKCFLSNTYLLLQAACLSFKIYVLFAVYNTRINKPLNTKKLFYTYNNYLLTYGVLKKNPKFYCWPFTDRKFP